MEISYKIPIWYIIVALCLGAIFPLGSFGYLDDSFNQSEGVRWGTLLAFCGAALYFFITPRNKKIIVSESGISIPNILFPPYTVRHHQWKDVAIHDIRHHKGSAVLILKTSYGYKKIYSLLCFRNFEFSLEPSSFYELHEYIFSKVVDK